MMSEDNNIQSVNVTIVNKNGLHARPAMMLVDLANQFSSEISIIKNDETVNGKSIMSLLTLAAECGSQLTIEAQGDDASQAIEKLVDLINSRFEEDE